MKQRNAVIPIVWACLIVTFASLPYLVGVLTGPPDGKFAGFTYNIDDACVYSSWVRQIADGSILIRNQFTSEPQNALQFNLFFLVLGLIARVTHLSPAVAIHLARIVLGIGLLMLVWRFSHRFLRTPAEKLLVVPVVGLSSGLGWLLPGIEGHQGPVDLWQPEAITFLSIYLNPLFLVGLILMIGAFHFLYRMKETGSWRDTALAGLMLLLMGNIHTYDVLTVGAVWAAYMVAKVVKMKSVPWRTIGQSAAAAAIAAPAIAYQLYLYSREDVFRTRVESAAPSPMFWAYLTGLGLVLILAAFGAWLALRERRGALILVVWSVVGFALPYAPVAQQRKLVMGLHVPLAILATIAVAELIKRVGPKMAGIVTILLVTALIPSNLLFMARDIGLLGENMTAPLYPAYIADSELQAMRWLRENTKPEDTVLAFRNTALFIPAIAGNRVYYGHWSETPDYGEKLNEWMTFIDAATPDEWRREFVERSGAQYIVYLSHPAGQVVRLDETRSLPLADLRTVDYLEVVFEAGDVAVYRVMH